MPHPFHYFVAGTTAAQFAPGNVLQPKKLQEFHLGHLTDLCEPGLVSFTDCVISGRQGCLFTPNPSRGVMPPVVQFDPDPAKQRWLEAWQSKLWVGWEVGNEPGPETLVKREPFPAGYLITDAVGRQWAIPVARKPNDVDCLPADIDWDIGTGEPIPRRKSSMDWIWELSGEVWDYLNTDNRPADPAWTKKTAVRILAINYRIGLVELKAFVHMGKPILDDMRVTLILGALVDMQVTAELDEAKKKGPQANSQADPVGGLAARPPDESSTFPW